MVDPTRPGSVPPRQDNVNDRIAALEAQVRELQARNMDNATVGRGGTFQGYFDNGNRSFILGRDRTDGVRKAKFFWPSTGREAMQIGPGNAAVNPPELEAWRFRDQADNILFGTDGVAGYGFVEPLLCYPAYAIPGLTYVAGVAQIATEGQAFFYNAAVWSQIRVRAFTGTITSVTAQLRLRHSNTDIPAVVSSVSPSVPANTSIRRVLAVPEEYISSQYTYLEWLITANGAGTLEVWPMQQRGVSRAFYNTASADY